MPENWYALLVAIVYPKQIGSDQALLLLRKPRSKKVYNKDITDADIEEMIRLKDAGHTYQQVGDKFGMHKDTVCTRMRRYKLRMNLN